MTRCACRGPDQIEVEEPCVEPSYGVRQMTNRGNATDGEPGFFADAGGISTGQGVSKNGPGRSVAASDEQKVQTIRLIHEHEGLDDLIEGSATGGGSLLGGAGTLGHLLNGVGQSGLQHGLAHTFHRSQHAISPRPKHPSWRRGV